MNLSQPNLTSTILISLYFFVFLANFSLANAFISRRAKCAIECYLKCAFAGTPKAVYCNCPLKTENDPCDSVTEPLIKEKTIERPVESASIYKDIRTITIRTETLTNAFIYIFEYSTIGADKPSWVFAGASSSPQITFTVPDPCRDYQFRTIGVLRSTDPTEQLIVFRSKQIPVRFPPFLVTHESIRLDQPRQSIDGQSLHISVSWHHPVGYQDSDIYGYDSPVAYPIRCQVPEDMLIQPRVEMVEGGAKMHLHLPVDVLQEKCRIYLEVRMIPRCVRIEYFDIQVSIELDCHKFPHLDYCKKEMTPECTDVIDLWGKEDGKAMIAWQTPDPLHQPIYHVINWGLTQSQGSSPFVTRRIIQGSEMKLSGNVTNVEIEPRPNVHYGVQVCAVYSDQFPNSPFHIVPVVPFTCSQCSSQKVAVNKNCIDCSKIEELNNGGSQAMANVLKPMSTAETLRPVTCHGPECASRNHSVHFISSDTVSLDIHGKESPRRNLPIEFVPPSLGGESSDTKRLSPKSNGGLILLSNPAVHSSNTFPIPNTFGQSFVKDETTSVGLPESATIVLPSTSTKLLSQVDNEVLIETSPTPIVQEISSTPTTAKSNKISNHTPFAIDQSTTMLTEAETITEQKTTPSFSTSNIGEYWSKTTEQFLRTSKDIPNTFGQSFIKDETTSTGFAESATIETLPKSTTESIVMSSTTASSTPKTSTELVAITPNHYSTTIPQTNATTTTQPVTSSTEILNGVNDQNLFLIHTRVSALNVPSETSLYTSSPRTTPTHNTEKSSTTKEFETTRKLDMDAIAKRQWSGLGEENAIHKFGPQLSLQNNINEVDLTTQSTAVPKTSSEESELESKENRGERLKFETTKSQEVANSLLEVAKSQENFNGQEVDVKINNDRRVDGENGQREFEKKGLLPNIAVAKVNFKSENDGLPPQNATTIEDDGRRLHQKTHRNKHRKEPCKQSGGIVCEFGCLDEIRCECPKFEANCIRGILCPFVRDLRAVYDARTQMLKFFSREIGNMLADAKSEYDKIYLEFGELSTAKRKGSAKGEEAYTFANSNDREHAMLSVETVDADSLFLSLPFTMNVQRTVSVDEKMYGLSVCALNSSVVPIVMEHLFAEQEAQEELNKILRQKSISAFARTLLSPMQLKMEEVNATGVINASSIRRVLEAQKGLLIFVGPAFFLLGLGIGLMCLCFSFARRKRRDRRLHDYSSTSLKYGPPNRRFGASALATRTNQLSASAFSGIGCNSPVGNSTTDPRAVGGGNGSPAQSGVAMLDTSQTNYYSDNTARFFMQPTSNQHANATMTISKNVHF